MDQGQHRERNVVKLKNVVKRSNFMTNSIFTKGVNTNYLSCEMKYLKFNELTLG